MAHQYEALIDMARDCDDQHTRDAIAREVIDSRSIGAMFTYAASVPGADTALLQREVSSCKDMTSLIRFIKRIHGKKVTVDDIMRAAVASDDESSRKFLELDNHFASVTVLFDLLPLNGDAPKKSRWWHKRP